jgi:hypothetical protein
MCPPGNYRKCDHVPEADFGDIRERKQVQVSDVTAVRFGVIAKLSDGTVRQVLLDQEQYDGVANAIYLFGGSPLKVHAEVLPLTIESAQKGGGE